MSFWMQKEDPEYYDDGDSEWEDHEDASGWFDLDVAQVKPAEPFSPFETINS